MNKLKFHNTFYPIDDKYNELYIDYFKRLYRYGNKFTQDVTLLQDSIQDVFADLWQNRHIRSGIEHPESYIFTAFRYTLFRKIKKENKFVLGSSVEPEPTFSPEHLIITKQANDALSEKLKHALTALTARQSEAIYLRFYAGLSYEQVAEVLNISVKATYKIMARSLTALKDSMLLSIGIILGLLG